MFAFACQSQRHIPVETTEVDSSSQNSEMLMRSVQALMNEIRVWEQRRDSVSSNVSVEVRDSVILHVNDEGNVISKEHYRDKTQASDRIMSTEKDRQTEISRQYIDSLLMEQRTELMGLIEKSNQVPMPVERPLSKWEQLKQEVGGISIGVLVVLVMVVIVWLIKKIRNKI